MASENIYYLKTKGNFLMKPVSRTPPVWERLFPADYSFKWLSINTLVFANPTLLCSGGQYSWLQTGSMYQQSTRKALGVLIMKHCTAFSPIQCNEAFICLFGRIMYGLDKPRNSDRMCL